MEGSNEFGDAIGRGSGLAKPGVRGIALEIIPKSAETWVLHNSPVDHRWILWEQFPMAAPDDALNLVAVAESRGDLSASTSANIRRWLVETPFLAYRDRLVKDIQEGQWKVLDDAFYAVLEFGTGGRRGKMYPVGTNVLNPQPRRRPI